MAKLRDLVTAMGFGSVRTLLQSGNLVFEAEARPGAELEPLLAGEIEGGLGVSTDIFVRSAREWHAIIARNPFVTEARSDPGHLVTMLLRDQPTRKAVDDLSAAITGSEVVRVDGRQAYVVYPDGIGRSRLTVALIEKKLGTRGTGRNWNTVLKVDKLLQA